MLTFLRRNKIRRVKKSISKQQNKITNEYLRLISKKYLSIHKESIKNNEIKNFTGWLIRFNKWFYYYIIKVLLTISWNVGLINGIKKKDNYFLITVLDLQRLKNCVGLGEFLTFH